MRKWMTWMITWILFAAVLSACGKEADDKKLIPKPEKKQEADAETETKTEENAEAEAETTAETTADVSQDGDWNDFCGEWILVGFEYSDSVDDIEPSVDNPYYDAENEWIVSEPPYIRRRKHSVCGLQAALDTKTNSAVADRSHGGRWDWSM